jgi:hypothetical protein
LIWTELDSQASVDACLKACYSFHDGWLKEIRIVSEGQVGDMSAHLLFAKLPGEHGAIELRCLGLVDLSLTPSPPDHDSIISSGRIVRYGATLRLDLNFTGGPMHGPPGGSILIPGRNFASPDFSVTARAMAWRPAKK